MPLGTAYPFGMRHIRISPITTLDPEVYGTSLKLPAARTMTWTDAESYETLRGDDKNVTTRGHGPECSWELEGGGYSADIVKTIFGGTLTDSGTTPAQKRVVRKSAYDSRPWFKAEGQAMSDNGGDVHVILYRCRATGDFQGSFKDNEWFLTGASGEAYPSLATANLDALYDIVYNETAIAPT
jgi:hypothetical protein